MMECHPDPLLNVSVRGIKLILAASFYYPADPLGEVFFNVLASFAEFEWDLIRLLTREEMAIARANGKLRGNNQSSPINIRKSRTGCMQ